MRTGSSPGTCDLSLKVRNCADDTRGGYRDGAGGIWSIPGLLENIVAASTDDPVEILLDTSIRRQKGEIGGLIRALR